MNNILVVEDDKELNRIVCSYLSKEGYTVKSCLNANEAVSVIEKIKFDLIISDIMMPEKSGFELATDVRAFDANIPILFMTARDDITSKQRGYRLGIDDYMVKPIDLDELLLHVGALLRRANIANKKKLVAGSLLMDEDERVAYLDGTEISLSVREFDLLFLLLSYPKRTFTRAQLLDELWGYDSDSGPRTVDVFITKIRDKFSACTDFEIITVHGLGYKAVLK